MGVAWCLNQILKRVTWNEGPLILRSFLKKERVWGLEREFTAYHGTAFVYLNATRVDLVRAAVPSACVDFCRQ